jgi:pimeloyl-ACP methyl ester carboxylesterase
VPHANSNGVELYYREDGDGRPALLIHGHTLDHRIWDWIAPELTDIGLRTIRPDLRGHGRSDRPEFGYHWKHHAADMAAVLDGVGVVHCPVIGYSIGGGIALEMAVTMTDRVDSLVLMSPVLPDRPFEESFFRCLREVARTVRSDGVAAAMRGPWMANPLFTSSTLRPEAVRKLEGIVADFPGAEYLATEPDRVERDWQMPDRLGEIGVPTLVIAGDAELPGFVAWSEEIARAIPGGRLELLAGLGHLHLLEDPERIAELITEHLVG